LASSQPEHPFPVSFPLCLGLVEPPSIGSIPLGDKQAAAEASGAAAEASGAATEASGTAAEASGETAETSGETAETTKYSPERPGSLLRPKIKPARASLVHGAKLISFQTRDFIAGAEPKPEEYDTILW